MWFFLWCWNPVRPIFLHPRDQVLSHHLQLGSQFEESTCSPFMHPVMELKSSSPVRVIWPPSSCNFTDITVRIIKTTNSLSFRRGCKRDMKTVEINRTWTSIWKLKIKLKQDLYVKSDSLLSRRRMSQRILLVGLYEHLKAQKYLINVISCPTSCCFLWNRDSSHQASFSGWQEWRRRRCGLLLL